MILAGTAGQGPVMRRIIAAGLLAGLLLSPKLWLSSRIYPQTPVWSGLPAIPPPLDWVVYAVLLLTVIASALKPRATVIFLGLAVVLVACDQSRLQPWFYQYSLMLMALSVAAGGESICQMVVVSVYFWSGLQKQGSGFAGDTFPWLVEPFHGWASPTFGTVVPFVEAGLALGLLHRLTRRPAVVIAVAMHASILFAIGPWGHNVNHVVWPWNLTMAASVVVLFWHNDFMWRKPGWVSGAVMVLCALAPGLSFFGRWDHYPSWALYSGNRNEATLKFTDAVYDKLPATLQDYVIDEGPDRDELRVAEWSYGELNVPAYPEVRVFHQVHRRLCQYGEVTLVIEGKATLLTPKRQMVFRCGPGS